MVGVDPSWLDGEAEEACLDGADDAGDRAEAAVAGPCDDDGADDAAEEDPCQVGPYPDGIARAVVAVVVACAVVASCRIVEADLPCDPVVVRLRAFRVGHRASCCPDGDAWAVPQVVVDRLARHLRSLASACAVVACAADAFVVASFVVVAGRVVDPSVAAAVVASSCLIISQIY